MNKTQRIAMLSFFVCVIFLMNIFIVSAASCPDGWILVPGNANYSTTDFCVMKYEAKNVGGVATSQVDGVPWASIIQTSAKSECESLGAGYHLITNAEWMTIARDIEQVADNWQSKTVGSGCMFGGHMDNNPNYALDASTDDDPYYGTGDSATETENCPFITIDGGKEQRRTFNLSNGEVIWDLSGNVWEWTDDNITCAAASCTTSEMPYDITPASEWIEFTDINTYGLLSYDDIRPSNSNWDSNYGVGKLYTDYSAAYPTGNVHAFLRGGSCSPGVISGAFTLFLNYAPSRSATSFGFRCCNNIPVPNFPIYSNFTSSETTNFSAATLSSVTSLTLAIDNKGKIAFPSGYSINSESEDYDTNIIIEDEFISVNTAALDSSFNSSATITLEGVTCPVQTITYKEGTFTSKDDIIAGGRNCELDGVCSNKQCNAGVLTFDVEHFTGFAAGADANLTTEAEAGVFYPLDPIEFTAEYINSTDGTPISGECNITFDDEGTWHTMDFNSPDYNYTRSFATSGLHEYNVTCSSANFVTLEANDTKLVSSVDIPEFSVLTLGFGLIAVLIGLVVIRRKK